MNSFSVYRGESFKMRRILIVMVYLYQSIGVSEVAQLSSRLSTKQPSKRGKSYRCKVWMSPIEVGKIIPVRQSVSNAPSRQVSPSRNRMNITKS